MSWSQELFLVCAYTHVVLAQCDFCPVLWMSIKGYVSAAPCCLGRRSSPPRGAHAWVQGVWNKCAIVSFIKNSCCILATGNNVFGNFRRRGIHRHHVKQWWQISENKKIGDKTLVCISTMTTNGTKLKEKLLVLRPWPLWIQAQGTAG